MLEMRRIDVEYARYAAKYYSNLMPWMEIMDGIRDALRQTSGQ